MTGLRRILYELSCCQNIWSIWESEGYGTDRGFTDGVSNNIGLILIVCIRQTIFKRDKSDRHIDRKKERKNMSDLQNCHVQENR